MFLHLSVIPFTAGAFPLDREPPGARPPRTDEPPGQRSPHGHRPSRTETPPRGNDI